MTDPNSQPKPKLSTEGQIFVTLAAAEQWEKATGGRGVEQARRDLTELLMDAHRSESDADQVRRRDRQRGIDVQARVVTEGRLLVVVSVHMRQSDYQRRIVR